MRNSPSNTAMPATCKCNVDPKLFANLPFNDIWKLSNKIIYILGLSLYFIVALMGQRFPFPAYKPAFWPGLFAFSAFVTKHNSLARETAYLLSPKKKDVSQSSQKKNAPIAKPFPAILRFKNRLKLLWTFEQKIEQPQEGTFPFALCSHLSLSSLPRGQETEHQKPINQSDKSPFCLLAFPEIFGTRPTGALRTCSA